MKHTKVSALAAILLCALLAASCADDAASGIIPDSDVQTLESDSADNPADSASEAAIPDSETEIPAIPDPNALTEEEKAYLAENLPQTDGSTSTIPLDAAIRAALTGGDAAEIEKTVVHSTTYGSFECLLNSEADIIFSTPLSENQYKAAADAGLVLTLTPIAREGFVFVVNAENPVDTLTSDQLRKNHTHRPHGHGGRQYRQLRVQCLQQFRPP